MFKGDVGLSAYIHHMDFLRETVRATAGSTSDDLHHDGVFGSSKRLHSLLMAGLGQFLPVHLRDGRNIAYDLSAISEMFFFFTFQFLIESSQFKIEFCEQSMNNCCLSQTSTTLVERLV